MRGRAPALPSVLPAIAAIALLAAACSPADDARRSPARSSAPLAERLASADADAGKRIFRRCAACHTIGAGGANLAGPNLHAVPGRPVASDDRFGYTAALRSVGGIWTVAALDAWLADPQRFAPGTLMPDPGLSNGVDRADLIAYLDANGGTRPLRPR